MLKKNPHLGFSISGGFGAPPNPFRPGDQVSSVFFSISAVSIISFERRLCLMKRINGFHSALLRAFSACLCAFHCAFVIITSKRQHNCSYILDVS